MSLDPPGRPGTLVLQMPPPPFRCEAVTTHAGGPFTLSAESGACLTVVGPSGVGKSLFLRALADLDPHGGEVWLGDVRQSACPPHIWRRQVAYVPASAGWWAETVSEHFADFAAVAGDLHALGLPADCGAWAVARLSSGERQRLSLVRSVANGPLVLLLDEPTANLDAETAHAVENWLKAHQQSGTTLIWVTHDAAQAARVADRQLHCEPGGLCEVQGA